MSKQKILVVEDEPLIGVALQESLENMGYEVPAIIDNADDLPSMYTRLRPDLIVMDVRLKSYTDGIDAARRLRLISQVPVIFLTAYTTEESRNRAAKVGPIAFLSKPVDDDVLSGLIHDALNRTAS